MDLPADSSALRKFVQMLFGLPDDDPYSDGEVQPLSPALRERFMGIFRRHMRRLHGQETTAEITEIQRIWKRGFLYGSKFQVIWQQTATLLWDETVANEKDGRNWFPPIELIVEMMCVADIHLSEMRICLLQSSPPLPRLAPHDPKIPNTEFTERYLLQAIRDGLVKREREDLLLRPEPNGI